METRWVKGQAGNNIIGGMILIIIVGFLGIISLVIYDSVETSMLASISTTTADSYYTVQNYTENFYDGEDLVSNVPIVLAAGLLLAVIVGFALYVRA